MARAASAGEIPSAGTTSPKASNSRLRARLRSTISLSRSPLSTSRESLRVSSASETTSVKRKNLAPDKSSRASKSSTTARLCITQQKITLPRPSKARYKKKGDIAQDERALRRAGDKRLHIPAPIAVEEKRRREDFFKLARHGALTRAHRPVYKDQILHRVQPPSRKLIITPRRARKVVISEKIKIFNLVAARENAKNRLARCRASYKKTLDVFEGA